MKIQELRNLSKEELTQKEKALKDELYKLNMQRYSGRVEKPHMFSLVKRDIARIQTLLSPVRNTESLRNKDKVSNGVSPVRNTESLRNKDKVSNGVSPVRNAKVKTKEHNISNGVNEKENPQKVKDQKEEKENG